MYKWVNNRILTNEDSTLDGAEESEDSEGQSVPEEECKGGVDEDSEGREGGQGLEGEPHVPRVDQGMSIHCDNSNTYEGTGTPRSSHSDIQPSNEETGCSSLILHNKCNDFAIDDLTTLRVVDIRKAKMEEQGDREMPLNQEEGEKDLSEKQDKKYTLLGQEQRADDMLQVQKVNDTVQEKGDKNILLGQGYKNISLEQGYKNMAKKYGEGKTEEKGEGMVKEKRTGLSEKKGDMEQSHRQVQVQKDGTEEEQEQEDDTEEEKEHGYDTEEQEQLDTEEQEQENDTEKQEQDDDAEVTVVQGERQETVVQGERQETVVQGERQETVVQGERQETVVQGEKQKTVVQGERQETVVQGERQKTVVQGERQETVVQGERQETVVQGERQETFVQGERQETVVQGEKQKTVVQRERQETVVQGERQETVVQGERQETVVQGERQETVVQGERQETVMQGERQEIVVQGERQETVVQGERQETVVQGERQEIVVQGERQETVVQGEKQKTVVQGERQKTVVQGERQETVVQGERQETVVQGERQETVVQGERQETVVQGEKQETVVQEERQETVVQGERQETGVQGERQETVVQGERQETVVQGERQETVVQGERQETVVQGERQETVMQGERQETVVQGERQETVVQGERQETVVQGDRQETFVQGERQETVVQGERQETVMQGERQETVVQGERQETVVHGERQETVVQGERQETVVQGERQETVVQGERQETVMQGERQETVVQGERQETVMQGERQETVVQGERQETVMQGERQETVVQGERQETVMQGERQETVVQGERQETVMQGESGVDESNLPSQECRDAEEESYRIEKKGTDKKKSSARGSEETFGCALPARPSYSPPSCLYNQTGKMCTVLGERFILTQVNASQQLITMMLDNSAMGPYGVALVWHGDKPKALEEVPDGEVVHFDAILLPGTSKFIALVVWQATKPIFSIEPYYNSYIVLDKFEHLRVKLVSMTKETGVVCSFIHGKDQVIIFSYSNVFIDGKKSHDIVEISKFLKQKSKELFGDVCLLASNVAGGTIHYDFICTCLWSGVKPHDAKSMPDLNYFSLYKKSGNCYTASKEQFLMHCDASTELVIEENGCSLAYEEKDTKIMISCMRENIYCGRQQVAAVGGERVKAHVRRIVNETGNEVWSAVMVQIPEKLVVSPETTSTNHTCEMNLKNQEPLVAVTSNSRDVVSESKQIKKSGRSFKKNLLESKLKSAGRLMDTTVDRLANLEKHFEGGNASSTFISSHTPKRTPKVFKNCHGTLFWHYSDGLFKIATKTSHLPSVLTVGRRAYFLQNRSVNEAVKNNADVLIQFDALVERKNKLHIVAIWKGKKPHIAYNKSKSSKYYFDIPGVYRGLNNNLLEFDVTLDGQTRTIITNRSTAMYTEEGQKCRSIPLLSHVCLHLKEVCSIGGDPSWDVPLVVVVAGQRSITTVTPAPEAGFNAGSGVCSQKPELPIANTSVSSETIGHEDMTSDNVGCLDSIPITKQNSLVFKNCNGKLYWDCNQRLFKISSKLNGLLSELKVGKRAVYYDNGHLYEASKIVSCEPIQFDVHFKSETTVHVVAIWKGKKPHSAYNYSKTSKYYFDIPGVYRGLSNNLLEFDVTLDGQTRTIRTNRSTAMYTEEGQHCTSIPLLSHVCLHLKEPCSTDGDPSWYVLLVVVAAGRRGVSSQQSRADIPSLLGVEFKDMGDSESSKHQGVTNNNLFSPMSSMKKSMTMNPVCSSVNWSQNLGNSSGVLLNNLPTVGVSNIKEDVKKSGRQVKENLLEPKLKSAGRLMDTTVDRLANLEGHFPGGKASRTFIASYTQKQTPKVFKNCHGTLFWHYSDGLFKIATKTSHLPSVLTVGRRAYFLQNRYIKEAVKNHTKLPIQFDVLVESKNKLHIVAIWKGKKPHIAYNDSKSSKYYFDIPGVYRGLNNNLLEFDVTLDGQIRTIITNRSTAMYTEEGQKCRSIPLLSHVCLHLKEVCSIGGDPSWDVPLVVVVAGQRSITTVTPAPEAGLNAGSGVCSQKSELPIANTSVSSETIGHEDMTSDNVGCLDSIPITKQNSLVLKNCNGKLYWDCNHKLFKILSKLNGLLAEMNVGKRALYIYSGYFYEASKTNTGVPIQFDVHFESETKLHLVAIWKGKKPHSAYNNSKTSKYYFDIPGVYRGLSNNLLEFDVTLDGQTRTIRTNRSTAMYTEEGQRCTSIPLSSHVCLHLKETCSTGGDPSWDVPLVVVAGRRDVRLQQRAEAVSPGGRQADNNKAEMFRSGTALQEDTAGNLDCGLDSSHAHNQMVRKNYCQVPEVKTSKITMPGIEDLQSQEVYLVLDGKINMTTMNYTFTYTYDVLTRTIPLPSNIAMDKPPTPSSLIMNFYLVIHQRDVDHPVCGWFEKRNRQLYSEEFQIVHSFNPKARLLVLLSQSGNLGYFRFESQYMVMGESRHLVEESRCKGQLVHAVIEEIRPRIIEGCVVNRNVLFLCSNSYLYQASLKFLSLSQTDNCSTLNNYLAPQTIDLQQLLREESDHHNPVILETISSGCGEKNTSRLHYDSDEKALPKGQNKQKCISIPEPSKVSHVREESSIIAGINRLEISVNQSLPKDRSWLCRKTLRQFLASGSLEDLTLKHTEGYPVLLGQVQDIPGASWFHCSHLPQSLPLPSGTPRYGWRKSGTNKHSYLLTQRKIINGDVIYQPLFLWPEGGKCDPYIITARKPFLVDTENRIVGVEDETSGSVKCYSYKYDSAYTLKSKRSVKEFLDLLSTSFYAVVEDISPVYIKGTLVEGEIFFLSSSYNVALAGISTLVGNYTVDTQEKMTPIQEKIVTPTQGTASLAHDSSSALGIKKVLVNKSLPENRRWLCRETLRQFLASGSLEDLTMKHSMGYPVLLGQVQDIPGASWFHCSHLPQSLPLPSGTPRYGWRKSGTNKHSYLLTQRKIISGRVTFQPLFLWSGGKCDPYIITALKPFLVDTENRVLGVEDETSGIVKCYSYSYDSAYTLRDKKNVKDFLESLVTSFYAVVEDILPKYVEGNVVEGEIFFLTSSYNVALAGISTLVGNYTVGTREEKGTLIKQRRVTPIQEEKVITIQENKLILTQGTASLANASKSALGIKKVLVNKSLPEDRMWLCQETLRQFLASGSLEDLTLKHTEGYPVLLGQVQDIPGASWFHCSHLPQSLPLPSGTPRYGWRKSGTNKHSYLLTQRKIINGDVIYQPLFLWPEGGKCDPYIITARKPFLVDTENRILGVEDETSGSVKCYSYKYDSAYTLKSKRSVKEFLDLLLTSFYAIVEDISPVYIKGTLVAGEIFFLSSSYNVALAGISTLVGNYTVYSPPEEKVFTSTTIEPNKSSSSNSSPGNVECEVFRLLSAYAVMQRQALGCKRGLTYHVAVKLFNSEKKLKCMIQDGHIKQCSDEFGIIEFISENITALCCFSSVYCNGEKLSSKDITKQHGKCCSAIILPLKQALTACNVVVDAMAVLVWYGGGPRLVTLHECDLHQPVMIEYEEKLSTTSNQSNRELSLSLEPRQNPTPCADSSREGGQIIQTNPVSCQGGSNVFSVHKEVLKACGLEKMPVLVKYFTNNLVIFVNRQDEMIWSKYSDIYISRKQCNSIEELLNNTKDLQLVVTHSPALVLSRKTVNMKAIIGFTDSETLLPGIHFCSKHKGILLYDVEDESAIAREIFSDIQMVWEQIDECFKYLRETLIGVPRLRPEASKVEFSESGNPSNSRACKGYGASQDKKSKGTQDTLVVKDPRECVSVTWSDIVDDELEDEVQSGDDERESENDKASGSDDGNGDIEVIAACTDFSPEGCLCDEDSIPDVENWRYECKLGLEDLTNGENIAYQINSEIKIIGALESHSGGTSASSKSLVKSSPAPGRLGAPSSTKIASYVNLMIQNGGKVLETNCARILRIDKESGILEVKHKKVGGKVNIFFTINSVYIDKVPCKAHTMASHLSLLESKPLNCLAHSLSTKNKGNLMTKSAVQVEYKAQLVWYGERPFMEGRETLMAGSVTDVSPPPNSKLRKIATLPSSITMSPGALRGCITEVHRLMGRLQLENGQLVYFSRDKCFLYGVCLNKVELWHVLSIDDKVEYEVVEGQRKQELKRVCVGGPAPSDPANLASSLNHWCCTHNVPEGAKAVLLTEAIGK